MTEPGKEKGAHHRAQGPSEGGQWLRDEAGSSSPQEERGGGSATMSGRRRQMMRVIVVNGLALTR